MSKRRSSKFCVKFDSEENNIFDNVRQIHTSRGQGCCESFDKLMLAVIKCVSTDSNNNSLKNYKKSNTCLPPNFTCWLALMTSPQNNKEKKNIFFLQHNITILLLFTQTLTSALLFRPSVTSMPTAQILVALIAVLASLDSLVMAKLVKVCLWRERGAGRGRGGGGGGGRPQSTLREMLSLL